MDLAEAVSPEQSGTRLAELDQLANTLRSTQIMGNINELALAPAKAREQNAKARLYEAQATGLEDEQRMGREFQQGLAGATSPDDILSRIEAHASRLPPAKGIKLLEGVETVRSRKAAQELAGARTALQQTRQQVEVLDRIGGIYREADTPEKWQAAHELVQQTYGEPSPYAQVPFQPGLGAKLSEATLKERDRLSLDLERRRTEAAESRDQTARRVADGQLRLIGVREKVLNENYNNIVKNEGASSRSAKELNEQRTRLSQERERLLSLKNRGKFSDNPFTSIPAPSERFPGHWYELPNGIVGRWHPNGFFYKKGEPFPVLPATGTGSRGKELLGSGLAAIGSFLGIGGDDSENDDALNDALMGD